MKRGYLSEYFEGVAIKRLAAVEIDPTRSHQHEFNATLAMLNFLGRPSEKTRYPARYIYLNDDHDEPIVEDATLTLYDARAAHPTRSEYRFYFPDTQVSQMASEGDLLLIAKRRKVDDGDTDPGLLVVVAENGSSVANQMAWLFGFSGDELFPKFSVRSELETEQDRVGFAAAIILESIGVEVEERAETFLDEMLARFGGRFPRTIDFSGYARSTLKDLDVRDDPDGVLLAWMEREEILFRTLERHLIAERLQAGFTGDQATEDFIRFSLSVQNRRKSRVGLALENHMEVVFTSLGLRYKRTAVTENKSKPDFLFPGQDEYHNAAFPAARLSMLAVKSTCKDRWRQVLAEADRIEEKHLLTLETAISANQTSEMKAKHLQLVVPRGLHDTYNAEQQAWLFDVGAFTRLALDRQQ
ncbi:type II restriction endonuclease [Pseudoxanthomonas sp. UC19_8]|uniref:type II restriction endonuclease n=1 Tax=Pseudoxanthomonas sp. UC19_8 TaxID=3350175 RepID=UPI0036D339CE